MKKLIYILSILIFSFSFFACASKQTEVSESITELQNDEQNPVINSEEENPTDLEQKDDSEDNLKDDVEDENKDEIENLQTPVEEEQVSQPIREIPEDIIEPEVTDIIETEEPVLEISEENNDTLEEDNSELITLDVLDDIPEPVTFVEEVEEKFVEVEVNDFSEEIEEENETENITETVPENIENKIDNPLENQDLFVSEIEIPSAVNSEKQDEIVQNDTIQNNNIQNEIISEENKPADEILIEEPEEIEEIKIEIIPSRSVSLKKGEYLDVIYPGNGWVYEGVTDGSKDVTYNGRKLGTANTTFTLIAKKDGTKIVHFYKTDTLTNEYIDDYLEIIISTEKTNSKVHKIAPDYAAVVPEKKILQKSETSTETLENKTENIKEKKNESVPKENPENLVKQNKTELQTEKKVEIKESVPKTQSLINDEINNQEDDIEVLDVADIEDVMPVSNVEPKELLQKAYSFFNEKDFVNALTTVSEYIKITDKKVDEGIYLKAQILEAQSGMQNIKNAVSEYEKIVNNYPASKYWDKSNKRIIYLKRFYLEVR